MKKVLLSLLIVGMLLLNNQTVNTQLVTVKTELSTFEIRKHLKRLILNKASLVHAIRGRIIVPPESIKKQPMMNKNLLNEIHEVDTKLMNLLREIHNIWRLIRDARLAT